MEHLTRNYNIAEMITFQVVQMHKHDNVLICGINMNAKNAKTSPIESLRQLLKLENGNAGH